MEKDQEILKQVGKIRKRYKTEFQDDEDATETSFIEDVNQLIQKIFRDDPIDVYTALTPGKLEKWHAKRKKQWWRHFSLQKFFMLCLLLTITGFLVSEAVGFYSVDGIITNKVWLKAILTEVCFIFLSSYRSIGKIQTSLVTMARVGIFSLMLFVISSEVIMQGTNFSNEVDVIAQKIELIEQQIKDKDELIKFYKEKGWGNNTRKQADEKEELVDKLLELKNEQIAGK